MPIQWDDEPGGVAAPPMPAPSAPAAAAPTASRIQWDDEQSPDQPLHDLPAGSAPMQDLGAPPRLATPSIKPADRYFNGFNQDASYFGKKSEDMTLDEREQFERDQADKMLQPGAGATPESPEGWTYKDWKRRHKEITEKFSAERERQRKYDAANPVPLPPETADANIAAAQAMPDGSDKNKALKEAYGYRSKLAQNTSDAQAAAKLGMDQEQYKDYTSRGLDMPREGVTGTLPWRVVESIGEAAGMGLNTMLYTAGSEIGPTEAIRKRSKQIRDDLLTWQQSWRTSQEKMDEASKVPGAGLVRGSATAIAEGMAAAETGGLAGLAGWFGGRSMAESLARADKEGRTGFQKYAPATAHASIDTALTFLGGKVLGAGVEVLAGGRGGAESAVTSLMEQASQKFNLSHPLARVANVLGRTAGGAAGQTFDMVAAETAHYITDRATYGDDYKGAPLGERLSQAAASALAMGAASGAMHGAKERLPSRFNKAVDAELDKLSDAVEKKRSFVVAKSQDLLPKLPDAPQQAEPGEPTSVKVRVSNTRTEEIPPPEPPAEQPLPPSNREASLEDNQPTELGGKTPASELLQPSAPRSANLDKLKSDLGIVDEPIQPAGPAAPAKVASAEIPPAEEPAAPQAEVSANAVGNPIAPAGENIQGRPPFIGTPKSPPPAQQPDTASPPSAAAPLTPEPAEAPRDFKKEYDDSVAAERSQQPPSPARDAHDKAQEDFRQASQKYDEATKAFRAKEIDTKEFLIERTKFEDAKRAIDVAEKKYLKDSKAEERSRKKYPTVDGEKLTEMVHAAATSPKEAEGLVALVNASAEYRGETLDQYASQHVAGVELTDISKSRYAKKHADEQPDGTPGKGGKGKRVIRGEFDPIADGRAVIRAFKEHRNVATLAHELGHLFRRTLLPAEMAKAEKSLGVEKGDWTREHEERFARMFERYLRDGKAPSKTLEGVFSKFKDWLTTVYKNLAKTALREEIPPELREVFDTMLGAKKAAEPVESRVSEESFVPDVAQATDQWMNPKDIKLDPERFQFKAGHTNTGEVAGNELAGQWNESAGGVILVWEDKDGNRYAVNGHHRTSFAQRRDVKRVRVSVLKEADGVSVKEARSQGAIINILEGQGSIKDYADFARSNELKWEDAERQGLLGRSKGRQGIAIGSLSEDNLYAGFRNNKISAPKAAAIAEAAPNDARLQDVGISISNGQRDLSADELKNAIKLVAAQAAAGPQKAQGDLFGFDDSAIKDAVETARGATKIQNDLRDRILAVKGALRRPEQAKAMGLAGDFDSIKGEVSRLEEELFRWEKWQTDPELYRQAREKSGQPLAQESNFELSREGSPDSSPIVPPYEVPESQRLPESSRGERQPTLDGMPQGLDNSVDPDQMGLFSESPPGYKYGGNGPVGTKHAATESQRESADLPPRKEAQPETLKSWDDAAKAELQMNPEAGREITAKVNDGEGYILNAHENAVLLNHVTGLQNEFDAKARQYIDAAEAGDTDKVNVLQARLDKLSDDLHDTFAAAEKAGSNWGKAGRSRQMMMERDFTLSAMETRKRASLGRKLTDPERQELVDLRKKFDDLNTQINARIAEAEKAASEKAHEQLVKEAKASPQYSSVVLKYAEKFATFMDKQADSALARFKSRHKNVTLAQEDFDDSDLSDLAVYTASKITRGATDFFKWSEGMVRDVGEDIRPHLDAIWKDANEQVRKHLDKFANQQPGTPKKSKARKALVEKVEENLSKTFSEKPFKEVPPGSQAEIFEKTTPAEQIAAGVSDESSGGQISNVARELARHFIGEGITEREANINAVHAELQKVLPDLTLTETRHAISRYGQFSELNKDPTEARLRELSAEHLEVSKIEDMEAGLPPKATGSERQPPTDEKRRLTKIVNDLKKKLNIVTTDPARQLKSALQSVKTRLQNQITDLNRQIQTRTKDIKSKSDLKYDAEADSLREQRDAIKQQFDEIFGKPGMTDAKRLELATRTVERGIGEYERRIAEGDFSTTGKPPLNDPALNALKAKRDTMRKLYQELKSHDPQSQIDADRRATIQYNRRLLEKKERLADRLVKQDFETQARGKKNGPYDAATTKLQEEVSRLQDRFNDGLYNDRMVRRLTADIANLKNELATGVSPELTPRQVRQLSPEARKLQTQRRILKQQAENAKKDRERTLIGKLYQHTGLLRILQTTGEFSFIGRQGGKQLASSVGALAFGNTDPLQKFGRAVKNSFKSFASEKYAQAHDKAVFESDRMPEWEDAGLRVIHEGEHISGAEETAIASWVESPLRVKGVDVNPLNAFNRSARIFFNDLRTSAYDGLTLGRENLTIEQKKALGHTVNVMTGYGSLGASEASASVLSALFYSPRNLTASFQFAAFEPWLRGNAKGVRGAIAKQYAKTFIGLGVFYALAKLAGADIETDAKSSDFMKLRFGDTRIDPLMGLQQIAVLGRRLQSGQTKNEKGEIKDIRGEDKSYGLPGGWDTFTRFLRSKLSPNAAIAADWIDGETMGHEPFNASSLPSRLIPITYGDVVKVMEDQGLPRGTALSIAAFFGAGLQTYAPHESTAKTKAAPTSLGQLKPKKSKGPGAAPTSLRQLGHH